MSAKKPRKRARKQQAAAPEADAPLTEATNDCEGSGDESAADEAERRLAALGEAFLNSIEAPVRSSPKRGPQAPPTLQSPGVTAPSVRRKGKRARKRERAAANEAAKGEGKGSAEKAAPQAPAERRPPTGREKRQFLSDDISSIFSRKKKTEEKGQSRKDKEIEDSKEFKGILHEVLNFVTPQLGKKERLQFEEAKIRALGGTIEKKKMRYSVFQAQNKHAKEVIKRKLEEEKFSGVSMSASGHRNHFQVDRVLKKKAAAIKKKKSTQENVNRLGGGAREKGAMVTFSSAAVKRLQRGRR